MARLFLVLTFVSFHVGHASSRIPNHFGKKSPACDPSHRRQSPSRQEFHQWFCRPLRGLRAIVRRKRSHAERRCREAVAPRRPCSTPAIARFCPKGNFEFRSARRSADRGVIALSAKWLTRKTSQNYLLAFVAVIMAALVRYLPRYSLRICQSLCAVLSGHHDGCPARRLWARTIRHRAFGHDLRIYVPGALAFIPHNEHARHGWAGSVSLDGRRDQRDLRSVPPPRPSPEGFSEGDSRDSKRCSPWSTGMIDSSLRIAPS